MPLPPKLILVLILIQMDADGFSHMDDQVLMLMLFDDAL